MISDEDRQKAAKALSIIELAVAEMTEEGIAKSEIFFALSYHLNKQISLEFPEPAQALAIKAKLLKM